jgi:hypothetical protein
MEPRTTNIEGENNLTAAGNEIGIDVSMGSGQTGGRAVFTQVALYPTTGAEIQQAAAPVGLGLVAAGVVCVLLATVRRRGVRGGR